MPYRTHICSESQRRLEMLHPILGSQCCTVSRHEANLIHRILTISVPSHIPSNTCQNTLRRLRGSCTDTDGAQLTTQSCTIAVCAMRRRPRQDSPVCSRRFANAPEKESYMWGTPLPPQPKYRFSEIGHVVDSLIAYWIRTMACGTTGNLILEGQLF